MKSIDSSEISVAYRALIVGYRLQLSMNWVDISMKLGIGLSTIQTTYQRVANAAGTLDLDKMLQHLESKPRQGAPRRIEPGSESN